ncbi:MAG: CoA transferase, partial [Nitrospinota bacterium]|nr:CoA transferase [Nitrospinota bacterium]
MPLSRFKVIDLTRARAGPTAVRQLADWGADVVRIELPPALGMEIMGADRHGYEAQNLHRNKRSLTLNLKEGAGRKIFFDLAGGADVVVENYRPQ